MQNDPMTYDRAKFTQILGELCNETLSEQGHHRLAEVLKRFPEARQLYREYMMVHVKLMDMASVDLHYGQPEFSLPSEDESQSLGGSLSADVDDGPEITGELGHRSDPIRWTSIAVLWAPVLAAALLVSVSMSGMYPHSVWSGLSDQSAANDSAAAKDPEAIPTAPATNLPFYVAQITGLTKDVRWGNGSASREFLLRLRSGDYLDIDSGVLELTYYTGARIILRGPSVYVPTGSSSGRLLSGELTGNVSIGEFILTTPTAKVTDLGTEFGVKLDESGGTSVCVFDGKVRVNQPAQNQSLDQSVLLLEGMAARIDRLHGIKREENLSANQFVRQFPLASHEQANISLVKLFNGMQGNRFRLAGVVAPDTGDSDSHPWLRADGPGYCSSQGFQPTHWHPFVDGVFVPDGAGVATQIDSAGHSVDLPSTTGRTWGPLWSRSRVDNATATGSSEDYWGAGSLEQVAVRLEQCKDGMIGSHANVGVTFDLDAVRAHFEISPTEFTTSIANLHSARKRSPQWASKYRFNADLRVFIDGVLRGSCIDFSDQDGELSLTIELSSQDRYLTLVTTNAGEEEPHSPDSNDHVVLIDPVITGIDLY